MYMFSLIASIVISLSCSISQAMELTLLSPVEESAPTSKVMSEISKPLDLLADEGFDSQIALLKYALDLRGETQPQIHAGEAEEVEGINEIIASFPKKTFPKEFIAPLVNKALARLRSLASKKVANYSSSLQECTTVPRLLDTVLEVAFEPLIRAEVTKIAQCGSHFHRECLAFDESDGSWDLKRNDVWVPNFGKYKPSRWPDAIKTILKQYEGEASLMPGLNPRAAFESKKEFGTALDNLGDLWLYQYLVLSVIAALVSPPLDASEYSYEPVVATPNQDLMLRLARNISPQVECKVTIPEPAHKIASQETHHTGLKLDTGLILSHAVHIPTTKVLIAQIHATYTKLQSLGLPKEICRLIIAFTDFTLNDGGAEKKFQPYREDALRCRQASDIYGSITKLVILEKMSSLGVDLIFPNTYIPWMSEAIQGHIGSLIEARRQIINRWCQAQMYSEAGSIFVWPNSYRSRETLPFVDIIDSSISKLIIKNLYEPEIFRLISGSSFDLPDNNHKGYENLHYPLADPAQWGAFIQAMLLHYRGQEAGKKEWPESDELERQEGVTFPDSLELQNALFSGVGQPQVLSENGYNIDPCFPSGLLLQEKFMSQLNAQQKKVLLITILLADTEQLFHLYRCLYGNDDAGFNELMTYPHDTAISSCDGLDSAKNIPFTKEFMASKYSDLLSKYSGRFGLDPKKLKVVCQFALKNECVKMVPRISKFYNLF